MSESTSDEGQRNGVHEDARNVGISDPDKPDPIRILADLDGLEHDDRAVTDYFFPGGEPRFNFDHLMDKCGRVQDVMELYDRAEFFRSVERHLAELTPQQFAAEYRYEMHLDGLEWGMLAGHPQAGPIMRLYGHLPDEDDV